MSLLANKNLHLGKVIGEIKKGQDVSHLPETSLKLLKAEGHVDEKVEPKAEVKPSAVKGK